MVWDWKFVNSETEKKTYVGIRLVDQLLVILLGDNRRANQDGNVGEAGVGDVAKFIEDILRWVMK